MRALLTKDENFDTPTLLRPIATLSGHCLMWEATHHIVDSYVLMIDDDPDRHDAYGCHIHKMSIPAFFMVLKDYLDPEVDFNGEFC